MIGPNTNSCGIGQTAGQMACQYLQNSNVGSNSCQNKQSCACASSDYESGGYGAYLSIGDNACNLDWICYHCSSGSTVPNGACSTSGADDVQPDFKSGWTEYADFVSTILLPTKRNPFHILLYSNTLPFLTRFLLFIFT